MSNRARILLADDHAMFRLAVARMLENQLGAEIVAQTADAAETVTATLETEPDLVVLDILMPGSGGLGALADIKMGCPTMKVLILTSVPEDRYAVRFFRAGADGYITKDRCSNDIIQAIQTLLRGGKYFSEEFRQYLAKTLARGPEPLPHESLSDRELRVMDLIASARTISEIAAELHLSIKTVSRYRDRIIQKTGLRSNAEMMRYAIDNGLHPEFVSANAEGQREHAGGEVFESPQRLGAMEVPAQSNHVINSVLAEIVGGFCHDIGNALAAMYFRQCDVLSDEADEVLAIAENVAHLHRIVRGYYADGSDGEEPVLSSREALIAEARSVCENVIRGRPVTTEIVAEESLSRLAVPGVFLRHIISPLVKNSLEAEEIGSLGTTKISVRLAGEELGSVLSITVEDDGPGWLQDVVVFQSSLAAGRQFSTKGLGRGVGLLNIRRLVSRLGGGIRLGASSLGGARVEVLLRTRGQQ